MFSIYHLLQDPMLLYQRMYAFLLLLQDPADPDARVIPSYYTHYNLFRYFPACYTYFTYFTYCTYYTYYTYYTCHSQLFPASACDC